MHLRMGVTLVHMPQQSGGVHGCSVGSTVVQVASGNLAANLAFYSPHTPQSRGGGAVEMMKATSQVGIASNLQ